MSEETEKNSSCEISDSDHNTSNKGYEPKEQKKKNIQT